MNNKLTILTVVALAIALYGTSASGTETKAIQPWLPH